MLEYNFVLKSLGNFIYDLGSRTQNHFHKDETFKAIKDKL
jgi:hypothetical protein